MGLLDRIRHCVYLEIYTEHIWWSVGHACTCCCRLIGLYVNNDIHTSMVWCKAAVTPVRIRILNTKVLLPFFIKINSIGSMQHDYTYCSRHITNSEMIMWISWFCTYVQSVGNWLGQHLGLCGFALYIIWKTVWMHLFATRLVCVLTHKIR